jgi:hypothetical protein
MLARDVSPKIETTVLRETTKVQDFGGLPSYRGRRTQTVAREAKLTTRAAISTVHLRCPARNPGFRANGRGVPGDD